MPNNIAAALIAAGLAYPGAHCCESPQEPLLQQLASEHAAYMARVCRLGHQHFQQRFDQVVEALQLYSTEIAAQSWKRQRDEPLAEIGTEMFRCWEQSPGHWRVASRRHTAFGAEMARGRNGVWYACILVANARKAAIAQHEIGAERFCTLANSRRGD